MTVSIVAYGLTMPFRPALVVKFPSCEISGMCLIPPMDETSGSDANITSKIG